MKVLIPTKNLKFNTENSTVMHVDINSCFATVEQQYNKSYRDKPLVVAAYLEDSSVIVAASAEAKRFGIRTGNRVFEAKRVIPNVIVVKSDMKKYKIVHDKLQKLLNNYTDRVISQSIDEFVMHFDKYKNSQMISTYAKEIKEKIKTDVGDYITVSIGIAPNRFLAKVASNMQKPDGLTIIEQSNFENQYKKLDLKDLHGINKSSIAKLNSVGIFDVTGLYNASFEKLDSAFKSKIMAYALFMRIHGYEVDDISHSRRGYSQSKVLAKPEKDIKIIEKVLFDLCERCSYRMRNANFTTKSIDLHLLLEDNNRKRFKWKSHKRLSNTTSNSANLYRELKVLLSKFTNETPRAKARGFLSPITIIDQLHPRTKVRGFKFGDNKNSTKAGNAKIKTSNFRPKRLNKYGVRKIGINFTNLESKDHQQLELFNNKESNEKLSDIIDEINRKYGKDVVFSAKELL